MNVLEIVRKQASKKKALRAAQKAATQAKLVYRGIPYIPAR